MTITEDYRRTTTYLWAIEGEVTDGTPARYVDQAATAENHGLSVSPLYQIAAHEGVLSLVEVAQARPSRPKLTTVPDQEPQDNPPVPSLSRGEPQSIPDIHLTRVQPGSYEYRYGTHSFSVTKDDDGVWTLTHEGPRPDRLSIPDADVYEKDEVAGKFVKVREARTAIHKFLVDMSTYNGYNTKLAELYKKRRLKGAMVNDDTVSEALAA